MTKTMRLVADYCAGNIFDFEERVQRAITVIDMWRCPLRLADPSLYNEIQDTIDECANDFEFDADDIDPEEVIWL